MRRGAANRCMCSQRPEVWVCVCAVFEIFYQIFSAGKYHQKSPLALPWLLSLCRKTTVVLGSDSYAYRQKREKTGTSAHCSRKNSWLSPTPPPPLLPQDRETGQRDHEGNGWPPHRGPLRAQRGLQVLRWPVGLHQGPEQEQRPLHPNDSGLHSPQELLCKLLSVVFPQDAMV